MRTWCFIGAGMWMLGASTLPGARVEIEMMPQFDGAPLTLDALTHVTGSGQRVSVTRCDLLLSGFAFRRVDGSWIEQADSVAFVNGREGRTLFRGHELPAGRFDRVRFQVGIPASANHANPGDLPADHPLNPIINGLHWSWQGGYVFLALEGNWATSPGPANPNAETMQSGYSYHIATDRLLTTVEVPVEIDLATNVTVRLALDVSRIFAAPPAGPPAKAGTPYVRFVRSAAQAVLHGVPALAGEPFDNSLRQIPSNAPPAKAGTPYGRPAAPHAIRLTRDTSSTHSRSNDELAEQLRENLRGAFRFVAATGPTIATAAAGSRSVKPPERLIASNATPYRLEVSRFFPQPALPSDNPLTEQGVELGRRLFHDERLSIRNRQSCASCHQAAAGFVDAGKRFSLGAEGQGGTRNAMPLFNMAWKSSFFWDGRAPSLREQVLMPIQNPIEMHESLSNVVAKLRAAPANPGYAASFARAFGTADITADRIARAIEQFLLVQVAQDSKFDRMLSGTAEFSDEEKRGFELFHTEYDPRRGQFGADCFHCHGGLLFQSQGFANNGLDATFNDAGRSAVTGKPGDRGKFAVPSLRNVAVTGPYMHDGRFATLEAVVEHYAGGVQRSATLDPNLAKHPDGGVPLSAADKRALVAFLRTLTEERYVENHGKLAGTP